MASYGYGGGNSRKDEDSDRKIFVGGLKHLTKEDLEKYFCKYGMLKNVDVITDKMTGNSRGFGFVTFEDKDCITGVLSCVEHAVDGLTISVRASDSNKQGGAAAARGGGGGGNSKKIHCRGVPTDMTEDEIIAFFSDHGTVSNVDLPIDRNNQCRQSYIFVTFDDAESATALLGMGQIDMNGSMVAINRANEKRSFSDRGAFGGGRGGGRGGGYGDYSYGKRGGSSYGGGGGYSSGGRGGSRGGYSSGGYGSYGGAGQYGDAGYNYSNDSAGYWNGAGAQDYSQSQWGGGNQYSGYQQY